MPNVEEENFRQKIRDAEHDSVTPDLLRKETGSVVGARLNDGALFTHLQPNEQPHFAFRGRKKTPDVYGSISPKELSRSRRYKVFHLVTDERWLCVVGNKSGDQTLSISLDEIEAANYREVNGLAPGIASKTTTWEIALETELGFVQIPVKDNLAQDDLDKLGHYLEVMANATIGELAIDPDKAGYTIDGIETYEPSEKTIATLLDDIPSAAQDEANQLVKEADDAADLVRDLKSLIDEYEDDHDSINDVVTDADGAEELRSQVASRGDQVRRRAEQGFEEVQTAIKESDPREVSTFAVRTASAAAPVIKYASRSNVALLGTLLAAGAVGTRRSSNQSSIFDNIDPQLLATTAEAMATRGEEIHDNEMQGEAIGAILGLSTHAVRSMAPEEYAEWVTKADPEAIMQGAEQAAQMSSTNGSGNTRTDRLAGASLGLLYGYADQSVTMDTELLESPGNIG